MYGFFIFRGSNDRATLEFSARFECASSEGRESVTLVVIYLDFSQQAFGSESLRLCASPLTLDDCRTRLAAKHPLEHLAFH